MGLGEEEKNYGYEVSAFSPPTRAIVARIFGEAEREMEFRFSEVP